MITAIHVCLKTGTLTVWRDQIFSKADKYETSTFPGNPGLASRLRFLATELDRQPSAKPLPPAPPPVPRRCA